MAADFDPIVCAAIHAGAGFPSPGASVSAGARENSRVLIATLDDHIKGRIAAAQADRESAEQMT
jgi:hypothetical protein